jgi:hypothetical protein
VPGDGVFGADAFDVFAHEDAGTAKFFQGYGAFGVPAQEKKC